MEQEQTSQSPTDIETILANAPPSPSIADVTVANEAIIDVPISNESEIIDAQECVAKKPIIDVPFTKELDAEQINEKVPHASVLKEGWLTKQGGTLVKNWRKRYFILRHPHSLEYYKSKPELGDADSTPAGTINLSTFKSIQVDAQCTRGPCFKLMPVCSDESSERTYYAYAETSEQVQSWIDAIRPHLTTALIADEKAVEETVTENSNVAESTVAINDDNIKEDLVIEKETIVTVVDTMLDESVTTTVTTTERKRSSYNSRPTSIGYKTSSLAVKMSQLDALMAKLDTDTKVEELKVLHDTMRMCYAMLNKEQMQVIGQSPEVLIVAESMTTEVNSGR